GYHRLVVDVMRDRFDAWAPRAAAGAVVAGIVLSFVHMRARGTRLAVAIVALVLGLRGAVALDGWLASRGPNVVLISIDTLRADRLGAYGYQLPTSPTLDKRLAREALPLEHTWSHSPKTTPSHMTLLTSLYPCVHGINLWWNDAPAHVLRRSVPTLAEVLKNAGYVTVAFTGGGHIDRSRGFDQGFDRYSHMQELDKALPWLDRHHHRKFFLFFHTYLVHDPYLHPIEYVRQFAPDYHGAVLTEVEHLLAVKKENGGGKAREDGHGPFWEESHKRFWASVDRNDPADVTFVSRLYDAGIRRMDDTMLRPLLDRLDSLHLTRDTLVVFTSDHGEAFAEHGVFGHEDLYGETLRVPLVLRFPGRLPAGVRVPDRARLIDVMPTILDLLHIPAPPTL